MIVIRVDDFPDFGRSSKFGKFDKIMKDRSIPYLLGIIPLPCTNPLDPKVQKYRKLTNKEIGILRNLEDVELAMHGVTHQTRGYGFFKHLRGFRSEFVGLDETALINKLQKGFSFFKEYELKKPRVLIPPFNTFDESNLEVFKEHFRFVTGGPETKRSIKRAGGEWLILSDGSHYGHAREIRPEGNGCITIHWGWEARNGFLALEKLLAKLEGKVASWSELR